MSAKGIRLFCAKLSQPNRRKPRLVYIPAHAEREAVQALSIEQRHRLQGITELSEADRKVAFAFDMRSWFGTSGERLNFLENMSLLLRVGLPILDALLLQARSAKSMKIKSALMNAAHRLQRDGNITGAFAGQETLLSRTDLAMMEAGEKTGRLDEIFRQLAVATKKVTVISRKIQSSLIYPLIILALTYGLFLVFCFVLIPRLSQVYKQLNAELPLMTRMLATVSEVLVEHPILTGVPVVAGAILWRFKSSRLVGALVHFCSARLPVVRNYTEKSAMTRAMRSLGLTSAAGIPLTEGLEMAAETASHPRYSAALRQVKAKIESGVSASEAFYLHAADFGAEGDRMATTLEVGERTGDISKPLTSLATLYEEDLDTAATNLQKAVEPLCIVTVAAVIGVLVFAMYYPIFSLGMHFMDPAEQSAFHSG